MRLIVGDRISKLFSNPLLIVPFLGTRGHLHWLDDATYLRLCYKAYIGKDLDLIHPKGFNEKLQWLKIHDRNPFYNTLVDKFEVKKWVASIIGDEYVIETYGVWDRVEDIEFECLPDSFVLKPTHDSGSVVLCRNKAHFNYSLARDQLKSSLSKNFFWGGREWPYKNLRPRIIAERMLSSKVPDGIPDYKFMCFDGVVKSIFVCTGRAANDLRVDFFDTSWSHMPFTRHYPNSDLLPQPPESLAEMITLAESLSIGIPFVRVDFYECRGRPYFGEMTFYPGCGFEEFNPYEWDLILGSWIDIEQLR